MADKINEQIQVESPLRAVCIPAKLVMDWRMLPNDVRVYAYIAHDQNFEDEELPDLTPHEISSSIHCSESDVIAALIRLRKHGYIQEEV